MSFFDELFGFAETTGDEIRALLDLSGTTLTSQVNGRSFEVGTLTTPSLDELREQDPSESSQIRVSEIVADVQDLHRDPANAGAFFQVASQFNLLEMVSPYRTPEEGVGQYEQDLTQGPACAIACGAGTVYRNWLVPVNGRPGQTSTRQIDCLSDLGDAFGADAWTMENGYALATRDGLEQIHNEIESSWGADRDEFMELLRIGIQRDTEVTLSGAGHLVTQAYCSALPVAYSDHGSYAWEPFARLVLDASYEATMRAAWQNAERTGNRSVFLTMLGGGAFGNDTQWILDAMSRALDIFAHADLDVQIVSYGSPVPELQPLLR